MTKYLMLICLLCLPLLLFLAIKTSKLSQYIINSLEIESIILSLDMKLLKNTPYAIA